jgi:hypothetical protein
LKLAAAETVKTCNGAIPIPNGGNGGDLMEDTGSIVITRRYLLSQEAKIKKHNKCGLTRKPLL